MADATRQFALRLSVEGAQRAKEELARVGEAGDRAFNQIVAGAQSASRALSLLGPVLSALSVGGLVAFAKGSLDAAGGLGELADQVGISTDALQVYRFAAAQTGVTNEQLEKGFGTLTKRIGEAVLGSKEAIGTFERFGIKLLDAAGNVRPTEAILREVAELIKNASSQAERFAIASELFGDKAGRKLVPLLQEGAAGLAAFDAQARQVGAVLSSDVIAAADRASDKIAGLTSAFTTLATNLVAQVAPALERFIDQLNRALFPSAGDVAAREYQRAMRSLEAITYDIHRQEIKLEAEIAKGRRHNLNDAQIARSTNVQVIQQELERLRKQREEAQKKVDEANARLAELGLPPPPIERGVAQPQPAANERPARTRPERAERDPLEAVRRRLEEREYRKIEEATLKREQLIERATLREVGMTEKAIDAYLRYQQRIEELGETVARLESIGSPVPDSAIIAEATAALDEYGQRLREIDESARNARRFSDEFGQIASSAFEDAILRAKGLRDILAGLAMDFARLALRQFITRPLFDWIGSTFITPLFSARGNAFDLGNVVPFARGGIVDRPTMFAFGNSRLGVMGEAGPEAVLPLRRLPSGRLGVEAAAGGPVINQTINVTVAGGDAADPAAVQRLAREMRMAAKAAVLDALAEQRRAGGLLTMAA